MRVVHFFACILLFAFAFDYRNSTAETSFICADFHPAANLADPAAKKAGRVRIKQPASGQLRALVVFSRFADDTAPAEAIPDYSSNLFDPESPGSLAHYFRTMSFGRLQLQGAVLPKRYVSHRPKSAYLAKRNDERGLFDQYVREILQQVDDDIDLGLFDNDGPDGIPNSGDDDRIVDYIFVLLQSAPDRFLLGGATGIATLGHPPFPTNDAGANGRPIYIRGTGAYGSIMKEGTRAQTVGVMAHEFGHALGLPDLYDLDRNNPREDSAGIGHWGLMGRGAYGWTDGDNPAPLCAWSREKLGWIDQYNGRLVELAKETQLQLLEDPHLGGTVFKIPLDRDLPQAEQPYLLVEWRARRAHPYNRNLPAEGALLWHIQPNMPNNNLEERKLVDLVCADTGAGPDDLDLWAGEPEYALAHGGNLGDATDPFDGRRLTQIEYPTDRGALVLGFRRRGGRADLQISWAARGDTGKETRRLTAVTSGGKETGTSLALDQNYPNPFNSSTEIRFALPQAETMELTVYNLVGQQVAKLLDGPSQAGTYTVHWDGRDGAGRVLATGVYLYRLQAGAQVETRRLTLVR